MKKVGREKLPPTAAWSGKSIAEDATHGVIRSLEYRARNNPDEEVPPVPKSLLSPMIRVCFSINIKRTSHGCGAPDWAAKTSAPYACLTDRYAQLPRLELSALMVRPCPNLLRRRHTP